MAFAETLVASTKSDASAYMQFISGHKREGFSAYAFVEDDDDMVFYQHALPDLNNACYLSCGGKENVLKVYRKLANDGLSDSLLFFVDRDTEIPPFEADNEIHRTIFYSWESYACQIKSLTDIVGKRFRPSMTPKERASAKKGWIATVESFQEVVLWHASLTHLSNHNGISLGMREVSLARGHVSNEDSICPCHNIGDKLVEKEDLAKSNGVTSDEIRVLRLSYSANNPLVVGRGKNLFHILKSYIRFLEIKSKKSYYGDYSTPMAIINCIPSNDAMFNSIKDYVRRRLQ